MDSDHINTVGWSPPARSIRFVVRIGLVHGFNDLRENVSHRIWLHNFVSVPLLGDGIWSLVDTDFNIKGRSEQDTSRFPVALME